MFLAYESYSLCGALKLAGSTGGKLSGQRREISISPAVCDRVRLLKRLASRKCRPVVTFTLFTGYVNLLSSPG